MLGIKGTYQALRTANGTAQQIACSIWGVLVSGSLVGSTPPVALFALAGVSASIIAALIWLPRIWLQRALTVEFIASVVVFALHFFGRWPTSTPPEIIATASHSLSAAALCVWALYLANLVHRQLLEKQRMAHHEF